MRSASVSTSGGTLERVCLFCAVLAEIMSSKSARSLGVTHRVVGNFRGNSERFPGALFPGACKNRARILAPGLHWSDHRTALNTRAV